MRSPLHRQAYHEAGHGVVAHFRGHRIRRISVKPGTAPAPGHTITYLGRTVIRFDYPDGVVAFAGYHAEKRFCPRCRFPGGYREDEQAARDILEEVAPGGPERREEQTTIWRGWERESRRLVRLPRGLGRDRGARRGTRGTRHSRGRGGIPSSSKPR